MSRLVAVALIVAGLILASNANDGRWLLGALMICAGIAIAAVGLAREVRA